MIDLTPLGLAAGFVGALLLIPGTASPPWDIQSWGGTSDAETAFRRRARRFLIGGLIFLAAGFALQFAAWACEAAP